MSFEPLSPSPHETRSGRAGASRRRPGPEKLRPAPQRPPVAARGGASASSNRCARCGAPSGSGGARFPERAAWPSGGARGEMPRGVRAGGLKVRGGAGAQAVVLPGSVPFSPGPGGREVFALFRPGRGCGETAVSPAPALAGARPFRARWAPPSAVLEGVRETRPPSPLVALPGVVSLHLYRFLSQDSGGTASFPNTFLFCHTLLCTLNFLWILLCPPQWERRLEPVAPQSPGLAPVATCRRPWVNGTRMVPPLNKDILFVLLIVPALLHNPF